jgi:gliding motility-associated-like protein
MPMPSKYLQTFTMLLIFFTTNSACIAQEICNNGKDDDGDGLIDLHDPDCQCRFVVNNNLLQNASFEIYDHCPVNYTYTSDYKILPYWQFGSYMSEAEYYHNFNCSYDSTVVMLHLRPMLPMPDGDGFVSILNSAFVTPIPENQMPKTYIGQCLQAPLKKGEQYTLSFYAGRFKSWDNLTGKIFPFNVAVFGNANCNAVPFGNLSALGNGCPSNYPGWVLLGETTVESGGQWVQSKVNFTVPTDIDVIEIGPDCSVLPQIPDLADSTTFLDYHIYYLDDLHLLPTKDFPFEYIHPQPGSSCSGSGSPVLESPSFANATYQWYKDSVAIQGATNVSYQVTDLSKKHFYNVLISTPGKCVITEPFAVSPDALSQLHIPADTILCTNTDILLAPVTDGITYSMNGVVSDNILITADGRYDITATDNFGCQRSFHVNVVEQKCTECDALMPSAFTPNGDGLNDNFKAMLFCQYSDFDLQVFNRWGEKIFESHSSNIGWDGTYLGKKMMTDVYVYIVNYKTPLGSTKTARGTITLIR